MDYWNAKRRSIPGASAAAAAAALGPPPPPPPLPPPHGLLPLPHLPLWHCPPRHPLSATSTDIPFGVLRPHLDSKLPVARRFALELLPSLSIELHLEILSWLPAISVIRFRSVCKAWNTATREHSFTMTHFKRSCAFSSTSRRNKLFPSTFLVQFNDNDFVSRLSVDELLPSDNSNDGNVHRLRVTVNQIRPPPPPRHMILGTCNGLVFMGDYLQHNLLLYNPITRTELILPPDPYDPFMPNRVFTGFGFDAHTNEYKAVKLLAEGPHLSGFVRPLVCTVVVGDSALGEGSSVTLHWRRTGSLFGENSFPSSPAVLANGRLHWLWNSRASGANLWSFDLQDEQVRKMPIEVPVANHPPCFRPFPREPSLVHWRVTATTGGCLALLVFLKQSSSCKAYVMMEYGVAESWCLTSSFTIPVPFIEQLSDTDTKFILDDDGKSLMALLYEYVLLFDPKAQRETILHRSCIADYVHVTPSIRRCFRIHFFTGNLIAL